MKLRLPLGAAIAAALFYAAPSFGAGASTATTNAPAETPRKKVKGTATGHGAYPIHGTVSAVDTKAMTFTIAGKEKARTIAINSESRLTKDSKPATLGEVTPGDYVKGRAEKKDGVEVLVKGAFGPKPEGKKKKDAAAAANPAPAK